QLGYWKERLSGLQTLSLPTDRARPKMVDYSGGYCTFELDGSISDRLRAIARENGTTMHSVMLAATSILLGKYSGQEDIVMGSPTANRQYAQTRDLIGFFVNTQVNRTLLRAGEG
ncbi:condensation domain-containing protein, partial [Croceitalea sp. MTPC5]|uniref:condensation domain-containing protein n=1 Tax=Croceitalea sp. MTPC5 TaxID=3056565 RepID=UPI0030D390C3